MSFKSQWFVKTLLVLSLLIGASSFKLYTTWVAQLKSTQAKASAIEKDSSLKKSHSEFWAEKLKPGQSNLDLDAAVTEALLAVFNNRTAYGISVTTIASDKQGGGLMSPMETLATPVKGTELQAVKLNLRGTYKTYLGLMGYLEEFSKTQAALVALKVEENGFELSLKIYGTKK